VSGAAAAGATFWPGTPLVDDDAPPALQPFLQRKTALRLVGGGSGYRSRVLDTLGFVSERDGTDGSFTFSAEGYPTENLYAFGSLGFDDASYVDHLAMMPDRAAVTTLALPVTAGLGVRVGDLLVSAAWRLGAQQTGDGGWTVPSVGGSFNLRWVIRRRWEVHASLTTTTDGAARASAGVELWVTRRFGVQADVSGGAGNTAAPKEPFQSAGGRVGLSTWIVPRAGLTFSYAPTWTDVGTGIDERTSVQHLFTLTGFLRAR
jgi:hypothetical protein